MGVILKKVIKQRSGWLAKSNDSMAQSMFGHYRKWNKK